MLILLRMLCKHNRILNKATTGAKRSLTFLKFSQHIFKYRQIWTGWPTPVVLHQFFGDVRNNVQKILQCFHHMIFLKCNDKVLYSVLLCLLSSSIMLQHQRIIEIHWSQREFEKKLASFWHWKNVGVKRSASVLQTIKHAKIRCDCVHRPFTLFRDRWTSLPITLR